MVENGLIPPPRGGGARRRGYVYVLRSQQDGSLYLGWTTDVTRRLVEHNQGRSIFTRRKRPWRLVGFKAYPSAAEAKAHERVLKRSPRMWTYFKKRVLNRAAIGGPREVVG